MEAAQTRKGCKCRIEDELNTHTNMKTDGPVNVKLTSVLFVFLK